MPLRILYVDDNRLDRELVRDALEQQGDFVLSEAAEREEFERLLAVGGFDLVLSDFNILGYDGLSVIDAVQEQHGDVPVVIVTGTGSEEVAVEAMKRGAADYLLKTAPHLRRLPRTIEMVIERTRLERESREHSIRQQAVRLVRDEVWRMESEGDISKLLDAVRRGLETAGVSFAVCGVNIVEKRQGGEPEVRAHNMRVDGKWVEGAEREGRDAIVAMWRKGGVHYRPDLSTEDTQGERADAFAPGQIAILEEMAQVLEEGFRRVEDLRALEDRNQALEREVEERRALEQQLLHSERLHTLGELAAGISHNLNNMLTGVLAPAQLLRRRDDCQGPMRQHIDEIITSTQRVIELVQRLGRSAHGDHSESLQAVDLNRIVRETVQVARPRWRDQALARGGNIDIELDLQEVSPLRGTESGLHDMLMNLLFNAVDAMDEDGVIALSTAPEGAFALLEVRDNGRGMDEQTRQKVFEPFFTTKVDVGTGLGLSTLYGTVQRWGGRIRVESAPGRGSTFALRLPLWLEPTAEQGQATPGGEQVSKSRLRVLVVEDDPFVRPVLARALAVTVQVEIAENGAQALDRFAPGCYDLALIDLAMPGLAGDEVARQIKVMDPAVVAVLMTGWPLDETDPRRAPFDYFLQKPLDLDALEQLLDLIARAPT